MTPDYLLQKFIECGTNMRNAQKGFFSSRDDPNKRAEFLNASKKAEKEFDILLESAKKLIR